MGRNRKRKAVWIILLILFAVSVSVPFLISGHVQNAVEGKLISEEMAAEKEADCILVLGAGLKADGTPNHMLQDRLDKGIELYKAGVAPKLLLSGDNGQIEYNEVNAMKQYVLDAGIPSEDIFLDHAGFSTYESMYRARDIFLVKKAIIITQKYHLYRSLYIAEGLGMEAYGVVSEPRTYAGQTMREIREILARDKDFFQVIFQPEPTYLGDAIPISGSGLPSQ